MHGFGRGEQCFDPDSDTPELSSVGSVLIPFKCNFKKQQNQRLILEMKGDEGLNTTPGLRQMLYKA